MSEPQETRPIQFSIKSMLAVMLVAALCLAMVAKQAGIATLILGLLGIPVQLAFLVHWNRWPWRAGVFVLALLAMLLTPADPYTMYLFAGITIAIYGLTALILSRTQKHRDKAQG